VAKISGWKHRVLPHHPLAFRFYSATRDNVSKEYREVLAAHKAIGWDNFLMGCWVLYLEWRERLRGEYVASQPERIIAASIERLWETSWDFGLCRNAAVYPSHTLSVEGEIIQQDIRPSRLCSRSRR
jgi:hypothetical protein